MVRRFALQGYLQYTDKELAALAGALDMLAAEPVYVAILAQIIAAKDTYKDFMTALEACVTFDRAKIATKNAIRITFAIIMNNLAGSVNNEAQGNFEKLTKSGLKLNKAGNTPKPQLKPEGFKAVGGKTSGQVMLSVAEAQGAFSFLYQCTADPITASSMWASKPIKYKKCILNNQPVGVKLWYRPVSVAANGNELVGDAVCLFVN